MSAQKMSLLNDLAHFLCLATLCDIASSTVCSLCFIKCCLIHSLRENKETFQAIHTDNATGLYQIICRGQQFSLVLKCEQQFHPHKSNVKKQLKLLTTTVATVIPNLKTCHKEFVLGVNIGRHQGPVGNQEMVNCQEKRQCEGDFYSFS